MKGEKKEVSGKIRNGYFLYEDGISCWGTNLYRDGNVGIQVTEEIHKKKTKEEKQEWYKAETEKKDKAEKEADAVKRDEEHKKSK